MKTSDKANIAINGFGRIGRSVFKALLNKKDLEVVAINDLSETKTLAYLLKHDSCYEFDKQVRYDEKNLIVDGKKYLVVGDREPSKLPWGELKIDIVLDCTGKLTSQKDLEAHLTAGAKKVILSAPVKEGEMKTVVLSVNEDDLTKNDKIISMASCTTNCLAPITKIIRDNFGIKKAIMTTVHSYTADQNLIDKSHKDLRRARAAALNIIPTTTGAAQATALTIPELEGKFDGLSLRVPTPVVSLCDIVYITERPVSAKIVNEILKKAADGEYKGYVSVTEDPLVSSDFIGNPASAIVDLPLTKVIDGDLLKIIAWYDNEWGYSCRLADLCEYLRKNKLV